MERKQEQEGSIGEEAAAMAASSTLWSLLPRLANGCAGYLGLARLCDDDVLKAPAATARQDEVAVLEEDVTVVEVQTVQSRLLNFTKNRNIKQVVVNGRGGRNH